MNATAAPEAAIVDSLSRLGLHWNWSRPNIAPVSWFPLLPYSEGYNSEEMSDDRGAEQSARGVPTTPVQSTAGLNFGIRNPQKQLLQFFRTRVDRVVPFRMERVASDVRASISASVILMPFSSVPLIEHTLDFEPGFGRRRGDQLDHCSAADEKLARQFCVMWQNSRCSSCSILMCREDSGRP